MRRSVAATLVLGAGTLVVWACSDQGPLTEPVGRPPVSANTTGTNLVSGFTFLPPLVKQVTTTGEFNAKLLPSVEICQHGASEPMEPAENDNCLHPVTGSQGPLILPAVLDVDHYKAEWNTDKDDTGMFRIFATLPGAILGYIDVELASGGGAKKADGETVETIVESAGRTIPVQFHVSNEGRIEGFDPLITDPDCEDCDTWTVPLEGGTFVLRGDGGSGPPLAGIEFPDGWSPIPRDLMIACNDGEFCIAGDCTGDLDDGPFPPGEGPLNSEQDPTVVAEWPLFCEFKLDPPLGDDPQEFFGVTMEGESPTNPDDAVLAELGVCQVDDTDSTQEDLHDFGLTHDDLEMGRRENGDFDRTGNTDDETFVRLPTPPDFLAGCIDVSAPLADAGPTLELPPVLGHLAAAVGDVLAPQPLMASRVVLRDGGIGSTIGSLGTIFGAVEVTVIDIEQAGFGTADVDGVNDNASDSWDAVAAMIDLSSGGGALDGASLYVMNNGSNLYLALGLPDGLFTPGDAIDIRFDNGPTPNGVADDGDDEILAEIALGDDVFPFLFSDAHFLNGVWGVNDGEFGQDVTAAPGDGTFLEFEKPLSSGDPADFDLSALEPNLLGICVRYSDEGGDADFPAGCSDDVELFLQVQLAQLIITDG